MLRAQVRITRPTQHKSAHMKDGHIHARFSAARDVKTA
jgi:hypothetical protein